MTDINTIISAKKYFAYHLIGAPFILLIMELVFQKPLSFALVLFVISLLLIECYYTYSKRRNWVSVFVNTLLPIEIWALAVSDKVNTWILYLLWLVLAGVYTMLIISRRRIKKRTSITRNQIRWIVFGCRTIFAFVMIIAVIIPLLHYQAPEATAEISVEEINGTEDCQTSLHKINPDTWYQLTSSEKLHVLSDICCLEFSDLHITHGFTLNCKDLDDETLAQYSNDNFTISINSKYIDTKNPLVLVHAVCHEAYHSYQHLLIKGEDPLSLYQNDELRKLCVQYISELSDYCSPHEDKDRYHSQKYEIDAEAYADRAVQKYIEYYKPTKS